MIRALLWLAAGVLAGIGLHLVAILAIPEVLRGSAQDRLAASVTGPGFQILAGPVAAPVDGMSVASPAGWRWCRADRGSSAGAAGTSDDSGWPLDQIGALTRPLLCTLCGCEGPDVARPGADPMMREAVCRYDVSTGPVEILVPASPALVSLAVLPRRGPPVLALPAQAGAPLALILDPATSIGELASETAPPRLHPAETTGWVIVRSLGGEPEVLPNILAGARCGPRQGL